MRLSRDRGFTLIETLAAIAISAMLLGALASYALAFMQTSREGDVMHRLQRELVFSLEAIASEIRVAKDVSLSGSPWTITQITYDGSDYGEREIQLTHDAETNTLRLANRVLSTNVAVFDITAVETDEQGDPKRVLVHAQTIERLAMIRSGNLPLTLDDEVILRNVGFVPPEEDPGGTVTPLFVTIGSPPWNTASYPAEVGGQTQILVTWATNIESTCRLEWGTSATPLTAIDLPGSGTSHQYLVTGLPTTGELYVRVTATDTQWGQVKITPLRSFPFGSTAPPEFSITLGNPPWNVSTYPQKDKGKLQIRVEWETSIPATCRIEWGTSPSPLTTVNLGTSGTSHNHLITGLPNQSGTLYVRITATDPVSGQSRSTSLTGYPYTKP